MTFGKRQLIIGALVAALGAAVYLNWQFAGANAAAKAEEESSAAKQLGQTVYVNTEISSDEKSTVSEGESTEEESELDRERRLSDKLTEEQRDFFEKSLQERSDRYEEALSSLQKIIKSAESSESAKKEAVEAAERLTDMIKQEADIEAEIRTKGFPECMVSLNNGKCTVIVTNEGLDDASVITIKDIVNRQSNTAFDNITITGV